MRTATASRLRLVLILSALIAVAAGLFSVFFQDRAYQLARDEFNRRLQEEATAIITRAEVRGSRVSLPGDGTARLEYFQRARDESGTVTVLAPDLASASRALPISSAGARQVLAGQAWSELVTVNGQPVMIHTEPVMAGTVVVGVAQVARSFEDESKSLGSLAAQLAVGALIVTLTAFALFWAAVGLSVKPFEKLTAALEAQRTRRDFDRRLRALSTEGEAGRLALAIDGLLAEAEEAYGRAQVTLTEQQRLLSQVTHELRAPLTTIRGNLGLLARGASIPDPDRVAMLRDAIDESERLTRLVNELSAMSQANSPQGLRLEPVSLHDLVLEVARKARHLARDRRLIVDSGDDLRVNGNRDAITQILIILIDNAVKFTVSGGVIGLQLRAQGECAEVVVRDNGSGIALEVLPTLFSPFNTGDRARNPNGLGLGLAIARQLCDAQHGRITVESEAGAGTAFTVSLPLA
ncbi:MAG: HAMP domain-containing histidine kinase [Thermoflexales bacterium]|nr:HAMP domain-containing histidine kinase [Thermoflexales bacterium]